MYRVVRLPDGQTRRISSAKVALQMGRARGAEAIQSSGQAHRWNSDSARAAALRMWKLNPVNRRIGVRLGRPAKNRKPLTQAQRQEIRQRHTAPQSGTPWWVLDSTPGGKSYWCLLTTTGSRPISERAALIRLGYLPNPRGFVPRNVDPYTPRIPKSGRLPVSSATGTIYAPVNPPNRQPRKKETR